jgi:hypothetical protein
VCPTIVWCFKELLPEIKLKLEHKNFTSWYMFCWYRTLQLWSTIIYPFWCLLLCRETYGRTCILSLEEIPLEPTENLAQKICWGFLEINNQCKCRKASFVRASEQFIFSWYVGRENDPTTFSVQTTFPFAFYFKFSKCNRRHCRVLNWLPLFFLFLSCPLCCSGSRELKIILAIQLGATFGILISFIFLLRLTPLLLHTTSWCIKA